MHESSPFKIAFLDVGHGDSIVLTMTDKKGLRRAIIIDSGNYIKTKKYIIDNKIDIIDYILITHLHIDHYRGINALISSLTNIGITIKSICWEKDKVYRKSEEQKTYIDFTTKLLENQSKLGINSMSKRFDDYIEHKNLPIDDVDEIDISIIYPNNSAANIFSDKNINNTSTVLKIEYRNKKIILPGDLEGEGWAVLKKHITDIKCDILKMPHHGDFFSCKTGVLSTKDIISHASPQIAIISTGNNKKYNHPDKSTVEHLRMADITVLCTQVTELCDEDRMSKRECVLTKVQTDKKEYNNNCCPCIGDIIFEIDDDIKLIPYTDKDVRDIKETFDFPRCINL